MMVLNFAGERRMVNDGCVGLGMKKKLKKIKIMRMSPFLYCASRESG